MQKEEPDLAARTKRFALKIIRFFATLPKATESQVIGKQLLRSGLQSEQTIAKHIAGEAKRSSLQNAAIVSAN